MKTKLHIGITSVLFDSKPEGICTGRLVRALLDNGHRVTLITSTKSHSKLSHPNLRMMILRYRLRDPRFVFKLLAKARNWIHSNFYMWTRRASKVDFHNDIPDVFYGRAWPHASLIPAYELSKKYNKPLILHFSDPFPAPNETISYENSFFQDLQTMVNQADALTFTNKETITYQSLHLQFESSKAHVLNHIAPSATLTGHPGTSGHFYHIGGVGPSRSPTPLLEGFKLHLQCAPKSQLFFVGAHEKYLLPEIQRLELESAVHVLPFTNDLYPAIDQAGVLVSIDNSITPPVFTPTKIVEYLVTDRLVFSITPTGSPVSQLISRSPQTGLVSKDYSAKSIADGLTEILSYPWHKPLFDERLNLMEDFSANTVAHELEKISNTIIANKPEK